MKQLLAIFVILLGLTASAVQAEPAEEAQDWKQQVTNLEAQLPDLFAGKDYAQAQKVLRQILDLDSENAVAWYNLACAQARLGQDKDALDSLAKAVRNGYQDAKYMAQDPDLASLRDNARFKTIVTAARRSSLRDAQAERNRRLALAKRMEAYNTKALGYFKDKQYDKAKSALLKILELDPDNAVTHYNLACAESRMGNADQAISYLNKAIDLGYVDLRHMQRDPDLVALRDKPGFKSILKRRDEIFRDRAQRIEKQLRERFGKDFLYEIDDDMRLIFATDVDKTMLADLKHELSRQAASLRQQVFGHGFQEHVTVVLPSDYDFSRGVGGFYNHGNKMLIAKNIGMTLRHEFTHACHFADQDGLGQRHPIWVAEGLATLFETSSFDDSDVLRPQHNYRLNFLQRIIKADKAIPWKEFMDISHPDFMKKAMIAYPQARYMMMYLYDQGKLKKWYDAYTGSWASEKTGEVAWERTMGKKLSEIEADWKKWVLALDAPATRVRPKDPYIGVQVKSISDGLEIVRVVPGSGADKAGLADGDVIVKIDDQMMVDQGDLVALVTSHEVGDKLKVRFRRGEKYREATVTLQAMPQRIPTERPKPKSAPRKKAG